MAKRKAKKFTGTQVLVIVVITALVVFFAPKLIHKCDDCGKIFVGTGYEPNAVENIVNSDQEIICKECAEKQHAVAGFFGGDIEEYRRGLFD
jgi:hypothetical protein